MSARKHSLLNPLLFAAILGLSLTISANLHGQTISLSDVPMTLEAGTSVEVPVSFSANANGIVQVQLFDSSWAKVTDKWVNINGGNGNHTFTIDVPAGTAAGDSYLWQGLLYEGNWDKKKEVVVNGVTIEGPGSVVEWLPPLAGGSWELDWCDEFDGTGEPENWYPLLGYDPEAFAAATEKGIRWTGATEDTAWMYSTKTGNHWLNGEGQLVMRIVAYKTESNALGRKVEAAYLLTGRPVAWDSSEPNGARWDGKFVAPTPDEPLYICARVKSDEVVGYSTWFAFWLFTETRAYNDNPVDGTEVDVVEIVKGQKEYLDHSFNVANHWKKGEGGSESKQFNNLSDPVSTELVDVTDEDYHTYGIQWSTEKMTCYVDGREYYTFTENIPTDPVDMMMLLTLEFQKDAWDPDQGDGRFDGPVVSEDSQLRVMSRVLVDHVRVYKKN